MWQRKLIPMLFLIGIISACSPGAFDRLFQEPIPDGFTELGDLTQQEQFLKMPDLSYDGQFLAALGGYSREEPSHEQLFIIDTIDPKILFRSENGLWESLAISSNGKRVAVCKNWQIFLIDLEAETITYLTDGCWPAWSPDGQRLAFVLKIPDNKQIRIRDLRTNSEEVIYDCTSTFVGYLDWSPIQDKLAFSMTINSSLLKLHTINIDGGDIRMVTKAPQSAVTPNFSPSGDKILYVDWNAPLESGTYLQVADLEGHCHRIIPPVPGIRYISLSPDGNKIAFGTINGLLLANTEIALGEAFWINGEPCTDS